MDGFWDARREIRELRARVEHAFRQAQQAQRTCRPAAWVPALDIIESESGYEILVDLPGVPREAIEVRVEHEALVIEGTKALPEQPAAKVLRRERRYAEFRRCLPLPFDADPAQTTARLRDGVLRLTVARQTPPEPQRIEVEVE